jgi:hypothetical protein
MSSVSQSVVEIDYYIMISKFHFDLFPILSYFMTEGSASLVVVASNI